MTLLALPAVGVVIPGDVADGRIRDGVVNTTMDFIGVGHYDDTNTPPTVGSTAIFFFELPDSAGVGTVNNAAFTFSLTNMSGSFTLDPDNVDIWGLGYVANPVIDPSWYFAGEDDTSTGVNLGGNPVVKIADDIMTRDTFDPLTQSPPTTNPPSRLVAADPELSDFLNLCYANGSGSGDYAVVRMSIDQATSTSNRHYDVVSADHADAGLRPELRMNENTTLLLDPFDDGSRLDGADPFDTSWWRVGVVDATNGVSDDSAGIGSGNAMFMDTWNTKDRFIGEFPEVTLEEPGDFLQLTLKVRPTLVTTPDDNGFRFGLLSGAGPGSDTTSTGLDYPGYILKTGTGGAFRDLAIAQLFDDGDPINDDPAFLGGEFYTMSSSSNVISFVAPEVYTLLFNVTRSSITSVNVRTVLTVSNDVVVLVGHDPKTSSTNVWLDVDDTFNQFAFGCNPGRIDFFLDNILIETSVGLVDVVPHSGVIADVIEMQFESQDGVPYPLQENPDLAVSNWLASGYTVTGDGGVMSVYEPDASDPDKAYRLGD